MAAQPLGRFNDALLDCTLCPRLVAYLATFRERSGYWGLPVPGFGDPRARILILGLAPGAHGANRTGRPFTGDGAGRFLYRALHHIGCATDCVSESRDDGLRLVDAYISNAVRCVPPLNKPTGAEVTACRSWLRRELAILDGVRVVIALGKVAHDTYLRGLKEEGGIERIGDHPFGHGSVHRLGDVLPVVIDTYHPSRYNVNVGRLTWPMFRAVFERARKLAGSGDP
jgi:uracil-DNA glycosylase family 4